MRINMDNFVSLKEISKEVHSSPKTVKKRMNDMGWHFPVERKDKEKIVSYLLKLKGNKHCEVSSESDVQIENPKKEISDTVFNSKKNYGYHVSIRGRFGWIVIHIGPKEEMESWANLLRHNDFEAKVEENQKMLLAYVEGLKE